MENSLKQRMVGIFVLVAIAVIILPILITQLGSKSRDTKLSTHIPHAPSRPNAPLISVNTHPPIPEVSETPIVIAPQHPLIGHTSVQNNSAPAPTPIPEKTKLPLAAATTSSGRVILAPSPEITPLPKNKSVAPSTALTSSSQLPAKKANNVKIAAKPKMLTPQQKIEKIAHQRATEKPMATIPAAESWAIQSGSFSDKNNAVQLLGQLKSHGFPAYMNATTANGQTVYRVLVGPELNRTKASRIQLQLQQQLKLHSILVKYKV